MPIGPRGEQLPYNNGPPVGNPMGVQNQGLPVDPAVAGARMAPGIENPEQMEAMFQEWLAGKLPELVQQFVAEMAAGVVPGGVATPVPEVAQMPVQGDTGGMGGNIPSGLLTA